MTINEILQEALKDPILKEKYQIPDEELATASFEITSKHRIIEVLKSIIKLKAENVNDTQVYRSIKSINFEIKD